MPAALAPFAGLAEAGCSAAAGGSGAVAPSAAAGGSAPENWTQRSMWKKAAELCGKKAFDDLRLGTSAGTGNLEDYLVESGQRVAGMAQRAPFPQSRMPASIEEFNKAKCMYV